MSENKNIDRRTPNSRSLLTLVFFAATVLSSCGSNQINLATLPEQYVVAAIGGNFRQSTAVQTFRSAAGNRQTWTSDALFLASGGANVDTIHGNQQFGTAIFGRGGSSPGIGSNGDYYVMAFWGRPSTVPVDRTTVSMFVSISHDGIAWTVPASIHGSGDVHSNASGIVGSADISVSPVGNSSQWFASYADNAGVMHIVPLPVTSQGFLDLAIDSTSFAIQGATTTKAPALSNLDGSLRLAWRVPGSSGAVEVLTTSDGRSWPDASTSTTAILPDGSNLAIEASAPFLHRSGEALILTSTTFLPSTTGTGNAARLKIHSSVDGITFEEVDSIQIGDPLIEGTSAAGPAPTQYVAVAPRSSRNHTLLFASGFAERTINTDTRRRVTIAGGP